MIIPAMIAQAAPAASTGPIALIMNLLPMVAILAVFYFLLLRPQQQRMKEHRTMLETLKKGDEVVTSGGIIGKVKNIADNEVSVDIAPNVTIKVVKSTITEVRSNKPANDPK